MPVLYRGRINLTAQDPHSAVTIEGEQPPVTYTLTCQISHSIMSAHMQAALSMASTPEAAGYRASVEQGLYSLYAMRRCVFAWSRFISICVVKSCAVSGSSIEATALLPVCHAQLCLRCAFVY
jgi:hypothetical protein